MPIQKGKTRSNKSGRSDLYSSQSLGSIRSNRKTLREAAARRRKQSMKAKLLLAENVIDSGFVHFGCWNRFNVDSGFQTVIPKLNNFINDPNKSTDFVLIAGDNYYPEKTKDKGSKKKIIHADLLKSGFDSLPTTIDVHIIMGNHDMETGDQMFVPSERGLDTAKACLITELERSHMNDSNHKKQTLNVYNTFMWKGDTAIVMFDTTIYDLLGANTESVECYRPFFNGIAAKEIVDNGITAKEIVDEQENHILLFLNQNKSKIKHVVLVGHYPIVSVKGKIDEATGKTKNKIECCLFSGFLEKIHRTCHHVRGKSSPEYHYLCADVHMYQRGTVNLEFPGNPIHQMTIKQYVVGTGGADLDDLPDTTKTIKCDDQKNNIPIEYSISEAKKENGFLHCIRRLGKSSTLAFEFIVSTEPTY